MRPASAADLEREAEHLLALIERRAGRMAAASREAVEQFFGESLEAAEAEPTGRELERFAPRWAALVPADPPRRAALARALGRRAALAYADVPAIRGALGLDEPDVGAAHAALYGGPPSASFAPASAGPAPASAGAGDGERGAGDGEHGAGDGEHGAGDGESAGPATASAGPATASAGPAPASAGPAPASAGPATVPGQAARSAAQEVEADLEWVSLVGGETLFRQGDAGDALFIVVGGRLRVQLERPGEQPRVLGEIGRGEMLGEMALVTGQPRSATIQAIRDSELVRLSKESFDRLLARHPQAMMSIVRMLVLRLQSRTGSAQRPTALTSLAVLPIGDSVPARTFCERLVAALEAGGPTALLSAETVDAELGAGAAQTRRDDVGHERLVAWLTEREARTRYVVYQAEPTASEWTQRCARQADRLLLVADADGSPALSAIERAIARGAPEGHLARQELVLLHRRRDARPRGTAAWLTARPGTRHHHVDLDTAGDLARLARLLTGRGIALVLGGGGARGYVHVGVVRALREVGIPIDLVGGASMGAIVGAQVALEWDDRRMIEVNRANALRPVEANLTLPLVSLSTAQGITRAVRGFFGEEEIEDLWLPYFAVSSDLTTGDVVVHDLGNLASAVRASISVPGFLPPVTRAGHLLVDGGVLNNLPADVAARMLEGGKVVAVNCNPGLGPEAPWEYGETLSARQIFWNRARRRLGRGRFHGIQAILDRTTMLGSVRQAVELAQSLDGLYLHPPIEGISFHDGRRFDEIQQLGYRYALEPARRWKAETFGAADG